MVFENRKYWCNRCNCEYPAIAFRKWKDDRYRSMYQSVRICNLCEQTARDKKKGEKREITKVRDTIRRHAEKFIKLDFAKSKEDFIEIFGWGFDRILHDLEHSYSNGCVHCERSFVGMGHGLSDITLDIIDPTKPPYYGVNARWICSTCNRKKSRMEPEEWGAYCVYSKQWNKRQDILKAKPLSGLGLFDWKESHA